MTRLSDKKWFRKVEKLFLSHVRSQIKNYKKDCLDIKGRLVIIAQDSEGNQIDAPIYVDGVEKVFQLASAET